MAEAAELIFTKAGLDKAINAKISGIKISINRIRVSDYLITSSDVPDIPNWSQLKGNIVFDTNDYIDTDNNLLRAHKVKSQTTDGSCVIITLYLGRSYGDFSCGSLGCYLDDGTLFAVLKLPEVHEKRKKSPAYPGDSVKFPIAITITDGDVIDISIIEPYTATIPEVPSYDDLPNPDLSEYSMYIVYNYTGDGTPAIAARIETISGSYWTFTLLAKNGWSNDFIQEDPSKLPYDDKTILAYDGETETWSKASGNITNDEVNPYIGTTLQDLSKETIDYNTQVYNKPQIRNSLGQEITIQNTIDTDVFNLVDKTDIETQDIDSREDDKVFSTSCVNNIKTNLQQLIDLNSIKNLEAIPPLIFNSSTYQLSLVVDTSINNYSSNPVQNQTIYGEFAKYPKKDELAKVAFSGSYTDLINTPEIKGEVVKYVEELPGIPDNFLYETVTESFTFIGAYNLTKDSREKDYSVTEEGLKKGSQQNGSVICSFQDLPDNWDTGNNYSQLFQSAKDKVGDVVIYEKEGERYYIYKEIDPNLYKKQLFYVSEDDEYNEIMLKSDSGGLAKVAFSGDYNDLINTPEEKGNVVKYVEELPGIPGNFLYETVTELFTFIGAYNLTNDSRKEGYSVTDEGLMKGREVVCSFQDLPDNWDSGNNYSQLFQLTKNRTGELIIYINEKDGKQYYAKKIDPSLYQKQLFYTTENKDNKYNEIMLKANLEEFKKEIVNLVTNLINNTKNS